MKNQVVKNLLRKVVVVAFAGVIIVSVVACGKPEDATVQTGGLTTFETMEETHEVDTPDLITQAEFTWEDHDLENTHIRVDNNTHLYAEPRTTASIKGDLSIGDELDAIAEAYQNDASLGFCKVEGGYVSMDDASVVILDAIYYEDGLADTAGVSLEPAETVESEFSETANPSEQAKTETPPKQENPKQETPPPSQETPPTSNPSDDFNAWAAANGLEVITPGNAGEDITAGVTWQ